MKEYNMVEYAQLLLKKRNYIIATTIIAMLMAGLTSLLLPNIYQTKSIIYVYAPEARTEFAPSEVVVGVIQGGPEKQKPYTFKGLIDESAFSINAFAELAESPEILKKVSQRAGVRDIPIEDLSKNMLKARLLEVYGSISQRSYAPIIRLIVEAKNKTVAKNLAVAWAQILTDRINQIASYRVEKEYSLLLDELTLAKERLAKNERAFREVKKSFLSGRYEKQQQLRMFEREVNASIMEYDLLQQKKAQAMISRMERAAIAKIATEAVEPEKHIRPKRGMIVATAGFLSFFMICLWVIIKRE